MFSQKFRIPRKDLPKIKNEGRLFQSKSFGALVAKRQGGDLPRFAVVVSTKTSKLATQRNRIKRAFREAVRYNLVKVRAGLDVVFLAKPSCGKLQNPEIVEEVGRFFDNTKILQKRI